MQTRGGTTTMQRPGTASEEMLATLNDLRARELAVCIQYMRHHYLVTGPESFGAEEEFKSVAIEEMKHAEALAERIDFLGGNPTTKPWDISADETTLEQMARIDLGAEEEAIRLYSEAIQQASREGDVTTRRLLEDILGQEEEHAKSFQQMLGQ